MVVVFLKMSWRTLHGQPLTCSMVYLRLSRHSLLLAWHGFVNPVVLLDNMKRDETAIVV